MLFVSALIILSFFRNPSMILALNQMRVGNHEKAYKYISRIKSPEFLPRKQHAYVIFLQAIMGAQTLGPAQSEPKLRKALALGLRTPEDNAMARMHLAGVCAQSGRRKEAMSLLSEAKKLDKSGKCLVPDIVNASLASSFFRPSFEPFAFDSLKARLEVAVASF